MDLVSQMETVARAELGSHRKRETQRVDSTKMAAVTARDSAHMKRMKMKDITKEEARATRWEERKVVAMAAAKRAQ